MALTDAKIRNTKPTDKPIKLADSNGLYLEIRPTGSKLWRYRYRIGGKENVFAIGEYPAIGLSDARSKRDDARKLVKQGIHPAHDRQSKLSEQVAENKNTFKSLAAEWKEETQNKKKWSSTYSKQVETVLTDDVLPYVGNLPIRSITSAHILSILERIDKRGACTLAILARQICSAVFRYAISKRRADNDPASILKGTIQRPKVQHHKHLTVKEIPIFLRKLEEHRGTRETYIALRLLMLTFVRTIELRAATWDEFDLDYGEWRIPPWRMKMGVPHTVPLSTQVVELLKELYGLTGHQKWLFPNRRRPNDCMTATTLNRCLEKLGYLGKLSGHGFRGTASTALNELGFWPDVIEKQLAHSDGNKVRASYNHSQYLKDRKEMMQFWADYLDGLKAGAKVLQLKRTKG